MLLSLVWVACLLAWVQCFLHIPSTFIWILNRTVSQQWFSPQAAMCENAAVCFTLNLYSPSLTKQQISKSLAVNKMATVSISFPPFVLVCFSRVNGNSRAWSYVHAHTKLCLDLPPQGEKSSAFVKVVIVATNVLAEKHFTNQVYFYGWTIFYSLLCVLHGFSNFSHSTGEI